MERCRVCGKPYKPCKTGSVPGTFNWKEVACSPECGEKYLAAILESRGLAPKHTEKRASKKAASRAAANKGEEAEAIAE